MKKQASDTKKIQPKKVAAKKQIKKGTVSNETYSASDNEDDSSLVGGRPDDRHPK